MVRRVLLALLGTLVPGSALAEDCAARLMPPAPLAGRSHPLGATDLIELRDFGTSDSTPGSAEIFTLSPDGKRAAMILRRADVASNRYCFGLLVVTFETGAVRLLDIGGEPIIGRFDYRQADEPGGAIEHPAPRWSPDGESITYLRRDAGVVQLWRVPAAGGAAAPMTHGNLDVRRLRWSADGHRMLYMTRPALAEAEAAIAAEGRSGFLYDTRFWPMSDAAPRPGLGLPYSYRSIDAATGTDRIAGDADVAVLRDVPVSPAPTSALRTAFGPGGDVAWLEAEPNRIFGPETLRAELGGHRYSCAVPACASRVIGLWPAGQGRFVFLRDWSGEGAGAVELFSWQPGKSPVSLLRTADSLLDCQGGGATLVCARESAQRPRHLERIDLQTGESRQLFDPNPEFASFRLGDVTRLSVKAADGTPAFADLVLPPGHRPGQRHPLVVVQYQSRGFLRGGTGDDYPIFLFAQRGYAVLSFQRTPQVANDYPTADRDARQRINVEGWRDRKRVFSALEAAVDAAIGRGVVDPGAIGISGMSDGASTAIWAILNNPRYRVAAVSQCCEDPWPSFYGNGLAYRRDVQAWGYADPENDPKGFWSFYSLAAHAPALQAPILMQMADREYRFALQGIAALKAAGAPAELHVFPDEYHIKWQPAHRAAIYRRALAWFDFWLRGQVEPELASPEERARWQAMRSSAAARALRLEPGLDRDQP